MKLNKSTKAMLLAVAATAFTSCESEELVFENEASQNAINFSTYLTTSRGKVTTIETLKAANAGFRIKAYKTTSDFAATTAEPNFMDDITATYTDGAWTYSPVQYWPSDGSQISFFAYAPSNKNTFGDNRGSHLTNTTYSYNILEYSNGVYTTNVDDSQNFDLVTAKSTNCTRYNTNKVALKFTHATSRIDVKVKTDKATTSKVYITGMKFSGNKFYTSGEYDLFTETWSNQSSDNAIDYSMQDMLGDLKAVSDLDNRTAIEITNEYTGLFKNANEKKLKAKDYFYAIPTGTSQSEATDGDFKVELSYAVITDGAKDENNKTIKNIVERTRIFDLNTVFIKGKAYCLNFIISLDENEIKLDEISLDEWDNVTTNNEVVEQDKDESGKETPDTEEDKNESQTNTEFYLYGNGNLNWNDERCLTKNANGSYTITVAEITGDFMIGTTSNQSNLYGLEAGVAMENGKEYKVVKGNTISLNYIDKSKFKDVTLTFTPTDDNTATIKFEGTKVVE